MEKEILTQINRTVLAVLLRALRVLYREDSRIRTEIDSWPEGLTLKLKCGPGGAVLALQKKRDVRDQTASRGAAHRHYDEF